MAATSISTVNSSVKYNLAASSTLFFTTISSAQPASTTAASKAESTLAMTNATSSSAPASPTTSSAATMTSSSGGMCKTVSAGPSSNNNSSNNNNSNNGSISTSSFQKSIVQQRRQPFGPPLRLAIHQRRNQHRSIYGHGHPFMQQIQNHIRTNSQSYYHLLSPGYKQTQSMQLAGKLEDVMSNPLLQGPLKGANSSTDLMSKINAYEHDDIKEEQAEEQQQQTCCSDYVYTAPCEHHPSKGQTEYLINDMFPKLEHDLSTIEFGIRIADFMPLAFKTVPIPGLAEKELELLHDLGSLPYVIQLQDSFVNDNGATVLVLPMLKRFDCHAVNKNICSIRKTIKQVLTGLAAVHAKNIVHLDINPSNLMVTHTKRDVVIIDFGLSMTVDRRPENNYVSSEKIPVCGTTGYIAPEIMNPQFYEKHDPTAADLYSLGVVLGEMLEPYIPDCDLQYFGSKYLSFENTNQTVRALKDFIGQDKVYPQVLIQAADLLRNMLEENPRDRKSAQDLLDTHPFLNVSPSSVGSANGTLELCDWMYRVQEIKYQKYLCQEQNGYEVYRYR